MRAFATLIAASLLMCGCGDEPEKLPTGYYRAPGGGFHVVRLLDHGGYTLLIYTGPPSPMPYNGTHVVDGAVLRLHPRTADKLPAQSYVISKRDDTWELVPDEGNVFPYTRKLISAPLE